MDGFLLFKYKKCVYGRIIIFGNLSFSLVSLSTLHLWLYQFTKLISTPLGTNYKINTKRLPTPDHGEAPEEELFLLPTRGVDDREGMTKTTNTDSRMQNLEIWK